MRARTWESSGSFASEDRGKLVLHITNWKLFEEKGNKKNTKKINSKVHQILHKACLPHGEGIVFYKKDREDVFLVLMEISVKSKV